MSIWGETCPKCYGYVGTVTQTGNWRPVRWCECKPRTLSNAETIANLRDTIRRLRARLEGRGATIRRLMEDKQYREKVARDAISDMIELQRTYEER